jgi:ferritin-like protein
MTSPPSTRRQLLLGGVGAAAGLSAVAPALARADSSDQGGGAKRPPKVQDGIEIQKLLADEALLMYGYEHALGTGLLNHDARELCLLQLAHEEAHVAALHSALDVRLPPIDHGQPDRSLRQAVDDLFNLAQHEREVLQVIVQIENVAQSGYFRAASLFHDPKLVRLAAEVLACEGQHWTMLVDLLHRGDATQAVPHPTVRGSMHIGTPHTTPH